MGADRSLRKTILAIETSCDETGLALIEASGGLKSPKFKIIKNLVSSQIKIHRPFGGVVPNLAKREHTKNLPILFRKIFGISKFKPLISKQIPKSEFQMNKIDLVAVTAGPGLEPALWTGINFAEEIQKKYFPKAELIGANHLEGHLYSFLLLFWQQKTAIFNSQFSISKNFPAIALIVSGGHTILLLMKDLTRWKKLGETRDDAAGEAFDKVARMLKLPYPGGPEIEKLARRGNPRAINFPRPMLNQKNCDFSFSGLKTAVFYYLRDNKQVKKSDMAASFQQAVVDVLVSKTIRAAKEYRAKSVILCGGVAANKYLRKSLSQSAKRESLNFIAPSMEYNGDNAAMIAAAGYFTHLKNKKLPLAANGNLEV